jgi:hypothetical protein
MHACAGPDFFYPLWDTHMSNLGFELWWAGDTTTLLNTQPQVDSHACTNIYMHMRYNTTMWLLDHPIRASQMWNITNNIKFRSRTRRGIPSTVRCVEGFTRWSYCAPLSPCLPPTLNRSSARAHSPSILAPSNALTPQLQLVIPHTSRHVLSQQRHHRQWVPPVQPHCGGGVGSLTSALLDATKMCLLSGWHLRVGDSGILTNYTWNDRKITIY